MLWRDDRISIETVEKQYHMDHMHRDNRKSDEEEDGGGRPTTPAERGARLVLTPKTRLYMDYLQFPEMSKNRYWPLQRPAPWMKYKAVTLDRAFRVHYMVADEAWRDGIVYGVEGCIWTELIPNASVLEYQAFPRVFALADAAWSLRPSLPTSETKAALLQFRERAAFWMHLRSMFVARLQPTDAVVETRR
mmetsp:Transcript_63121/g.73467  ORF Transcript_63121/g.73467 Transcript_63121/m.73467 type:complete len:191 (+) Transcript_63121:220-792(+)